MDLLSRENVKNLLKNHGILPKKKFGQNFLTDKSAMARILAAADIGKDDIVLEIGAGIGNLTQELAKKAKRVIAVEKDREMVEILKKTLKEYPNVQIINNDIRFLEIRSDIRKSDFPNIDDRKSDFKTSGAYKLAANLPYYITSPVIRKFLEAENPPKNITLVIQKEVAQRICAKPPDMNLLAVSVQFLAEPKIISYIKKGSFWPVPKVDSAIIKITPLVRPRLAESSLFFKIVHSGFSQPRKQLLNNLSNGLKMDREEVKSWLLENNLQPSQRAETLSLDDWLHLTKNDFGDIKRPAVFKN